MAAARYDPDADAVYVPLAPGDPDGYGRELDDGDPARIVHYDRAGAVVGVELLFVSQGVDLRGVPQADRVAGALRDLGLPIVAA
jgi:uncharacterized protein YuzE